MSNKTLLDRQLQSLFGASLPLGSRIPFELNHNVQTWGLYARSRMDLSIAAGAADGTVRNRGSVLAGIRRISMEDNGEEKTIVDARVAKVFAEMLAEQALDDFTRLASGAVQANTILHEMLPLHFALPRLVRPFETVFMEADVKKDIRFWVETVPDLRAALSSGNDRTWTINSWTLELGQEFDPDTQLRPFYVPVMREIARDVLAVAPGADHPIRIETDAPLAGIVVQQEAGGFEVTDIIDAAQLQSDSRDFQRGAFTQDFLRQYQQTKFAGEVADGGYLRYWFCQGGKLSNALDPRREPGLSLLVNVDGLSAVAGTNIIHVWGLELREVPGITRPFVEG